MESQDCQPNLNDKLNVVKNNGVKISKLEMKLDPDWKPLENILWINVAWFAYLHLAAAYGLYLVLAGEVKILTLLFSKFAKFRQFNL